jgi:poly(3-hydroxybutyrate) depolymerase
VRAVAPVGYTGPWPRVSIWHGSADDVVDPANARLLAEQWSVLQGFDSGATSTEVTGKRRTTWGSPERPAVELWMLPDMPHAWPAKAVERVAQFWGIGGD